jgi:hypothetical protein
MNKPQVVSAEVFRLMQDLPGCVPASGKSDSNWLPRQSISIGNSPAADSNT